MTAPNNQPAPEDEIRPMTHEERKALNEFTMAELHSEPGAEVASERAEDTNAELAMLRDYVGSSYLLSDFQNVQQMRDTIATLRAEIAELKAARDEANESVTLNYNTILELRQIITETKAELDICRSALGIQIHEKIPEQTPTFGSILVDSVGSRRRIAPATENEEKIANELATLRAQLEAKEAEVENAKSALGEHPDSEVDIAQRISELRDQARKPFHESTESMREKERLRAEVEELKENLENSRANFRDALETSLKKNPIIARLTAELDAVRKEFESTQSTALMTFGQLKAARERADAAQARCGDLERALRNLESEIANTFWISDDGNTQRPGTPEDGDVGEKLEKAWAEARKLLTPSQQPDKEHVGTGAIAKVYKKGDPEPTCDCADWGMMDHLSSCAVKLWQKAQEEPNPEPVKAGEWLPIESAPKDGTAFLACVITDANMEDRAELKIAIGCYDIALDCFGLIDASGNGYSEDETFYYWQPLPAPPIVSEGKATEGEG